MQSVYNDMVKFYAYNHNYEPSIFSQLSFPEVRPIAFQTHLCHEAPFGDLCIKLFKFHYIPCEPSYYIDHRKFIYDYV